MHNGLPAGEAIDVKARIRYDDEREDEIAAEELKVRAAPAFANSIAGLPFGLDGMLGPAFGRGRRALVEERFPGTSARDAGRRTQRQLRTSRSIPGLPAIATHVPAAKRRAPERCSSFRTIGLCRVARFLEEARFEGFVTHLFAIRAFLPDAVGDAHAGALAALRDALRDELDRLFIKLRLPNYAIAARDVETPSLRAVVERLLHETASARGTPAEPPDAAVTLAGTFEPAALSEFADRVEDAELASAPTWAALARLLPDSPSEFARYRAPLCDRLDAMMEFESAEFVAALQRDRDGALDAALDDVLAGTARGRAMILAAAVVAGVLILATLALFAVRAKPRAVSPRSSGDDTWIAGAGNDLAGLSESERCDVVFAIDALEDDASRPLLERALERFVRSGRLGRGACARAPWRRRMRRAISRRESGERGVAHLGDARAARLVGVSEAPNEFDVQSKGEARIGEVARGLDARFNYGFL